MRYDPRLLATYFARLAPRERLLLSVAALSIVLVGGYNLAWEPMQSSREVIARRITAKERDLKEMQKLRDVYLDQLRRLEASQSTISQDDPNFSLFAYLDSTIAQAVGREHVTSMNPSSKNVGNDYQEQLVEIHLTQISLPQLVDLLYRIEKGDHPLRMPRMQVKRRYNDIYNFDVMAVVSFLKAVSS